VLPLNEKLSDLPVGCEFAPAPFCCSVPALGVRDEPPCSRLLDRENFLAPRMCAGTLSRSEGVAERALAALLRPARETLDHVK
jgi:hypothetical protein